MPVYLIATLDTKGREIAFVEERLHALGVESRIIDAGCQGTPAVAADVPREAVFAAAGSTLAAERERGDRGASVTAAATGVARIVGERFAAGEVDGVLAIGGSAGTTIGTAAMRALPLGVPKVMVSTLASGQVRPYVGDKDVFMLNAVTDIAGLNRITRAILDEAARALAGLIKLPAAPAGGADRPLIAASMFGVTTPCVELARSVLEAAGYEVLVFHATGNGG
ncbi:MAG TPA: Tm-1-like ATP-binding domain-containing protein, partial [Planctomycetaceae bacterium]|nr:Tm-1-like ATP-binding domain-containing protein [Planctomycetaceae bacterium]